MEVRKIVGLFGYWMANLCPLWAAYRELISGRLIGLDKCPGSSPVRVGETCWRLLANCVLTLMGEDSKEACGTEQLYRGFEDAIYGGIHTVWLLWQKHSNEEYWGFLLIDVCNLFNE